MRDATLILTVAGLLALGACTPAEGPPTEETETATETTETTEPMAGEQTPATEETGMEGPKIAATTLQSAAESDVSGTVTFTEQDGSVQVVARVNGVERAGLHGFHVHQTGDCSAADFTSAGGHFAPQGNRHACPDGDEHHAGDLGNIEIGEDGSGTLDVTSDMLSLTENAPSSVLGKAVILHAGEDDCTSQPSGAAGDRLACGVVEMQSGEMTTTVEGEGAMEGEDETADEGDTGY